LESFNRFWKDFNYPEDKANAADAWLDIDQLTDTLVDHICAAAKAAARVRPDLITKGRTPKMAQGWLNGRRWEDYNPKQIQESKDLICKKCGEKSSSIIDGLCKQCGDV